MIYVWHHLVALVLGWLLLAAIPRFHRFRSQPGLAVWLLQAGVLTCGIAALCLPYAIAVVPYHRGLIGGLGQLAGALQTGQLAGWQLTAAAIGMLGTLWLLAISTREVASTARHRRRQRALLQLVGRVRADGVTIIPHSVPAAWCLPGRIPVIVGTSAAEEQLTDEEWAAVRAHEHRHATRRHDIALVPFVIAHRLLPVRVLHHARTEAELLLEMCADDFATRLGGPDPLVRALVRFGSVRLRCFPAHTLGAAFTDVEARLHRIQGRPISPTPVTIAVAVVAVGAAATLLATPLSLIGLPR